MFSESDLQKADEIFEATARHLLDKNAQMLSKYRYLLLMESMVSMHKHALVTTNGSVFGQHLFIPVI